MKLNVKKALELMEKDVKRNWKKLDWEYEIKTDEVSVGANVALDNIKGGVRAMIKAFSGGGTICRAVFDKIEPTEEVLKLINQFNEEDYFFKAFIREDGFLELSSFFVAYEINMFKSYASEFLYRLADLADNGIIQTLASFTYVED